MTKLNLEQRESLADMMDSPAWDALLTYVQMSVENHETRLLTCDMSVNDRELILRKARLEGAMDVQRSIMSMKRNIGSSKKKERDDA